MLCFDFNDKYFIKFDSKLFLIIHQLFEYSFEHLFVKYFKLSLSFV
jgi:hypothetical protein